MAAVATQRKPIAAGAEIGKVSPAPTSETAASAVLMLACCAILPVRAARLLQMKVATAAREYGTSTRKPVPSALVPASARTIVGSQTLMP